MKKNGLIEYHEFLRFRDQVIAEITEISVSTERKINKSGKEVIARPVGVIRTDEQFIYFSKQLLKWKESVNELNSIDEHVYSLTSTKFNPMPEIISGARAISISVNPVTAVREIKKSVLIRRLKDNIHALEDSPLPASSALLEYLKSELSAMENDGEDTYVSRNSNGTETALLVSPLLGKQYRVRVPFAGMLIDNRFDDVIIGKAKPQAERSDRIDYSAIPEVRCSLPNISGKLYPKSQVEAARRFMIEAKTPIIDPIID